MASIEIVMGEQVNKQGVIFESTKALLKCLLLLCETGKHSGMITPIC